MRGFVPGSAPPLALLLRGVLGAQSPLLSPPCAVCLWGGSRGPDDSRAPMRLLRGSPDVPEGVSSSHRKISASRYPFRREVYLGGSECGFPRTSSARACSPSELRRVSRRQPPAGRRLLARAEPSVPPGGRGRPRALGEVAGPRGLSPATAPSAFRARCVPRVSSPRVSPAALGCRLSVALSSVSSRARARLWAFALWSRRGLRCVFHRRRSPSPPAPPPRRVLVTKRGGCSYFLLFFALKFSCCNCLTPYSEKAIILCFCLSP